MAGLVPPTYNIDEFFLNTTFDQTVLDRYLSDTSINWRIIDWNVVLEKLENAWINVAHRLPATSLHGRIVILDFFTYCCINCMHILPYLKRLENTYSGGEVQVIGVHSAKFSNEKDTVNVTHAVQRYEIEHPVINDVDLLLWRMFHVRCWPTIAIFGPDGRLVFWLEGESHVTELEQLVQTLLDYYQRHGKLKKEVVTEARSNEGNLNGNTAGTLNRGVVGKKSFQLRFPGKIALSPSKRLLAISDSGNHRIIIVELLEVGKSRVLKIIGQTNKLGSADGSFTTCQFHSPQGISWTDEETLFVADTENHLLRKVNLKEELVSTIAGTSLQGQDLVGGKENSKQEIGSPWDLIIVDTEPSKRFLLIAAAGTHQIWILPLTDTIVVGKRKFEPGRLYAFAGNGNEGARNNSYPQQATFAQPSGLCLDKGGIGSNPTAYVADSESSSVRAIDLKSGAVKNVAGGDMDPQNLFAFGDVDSVGFEAKLQHPLAVCYCDQNGTLYVADSYNHKIKAIDPVSRNCGTLAVHFEHDSPTRFNEPSGICVAFPLLYVADTNNHLIWVVNLETHRAHRLEITHPDECPDDVVDCGHATTSPDQVINLDPAKGPVNVRIRLSIPTELSLTTNAPHSWKISASGFKLYTANHTPMENAADGLVFSQNEAVLPSFYVDQKNDIDSTDAHSLHLDLTVYVCKSESGLCTFRSRRIEFKWTSGELQDGGDDVLIEWTL